MPVRKEKRWNRPPAPHPNPVSIGWGERDRRSGEGGDDQSVGCHGLLVLLGGGLGGIGWFVGTGARGVLALPTVAFEMAR
jgi:hypothetical protein